MDNGTTNPTQPNPSGAVTDVSSAFTLLFYPHGELREIPTKMSCRPCSKGRIGSIVATQHDTCLYGKYLSDGSCDSSIFCPGRTCH